MLFVLEFVHVSSVAFVFVCVRSFSKQPPRPSTQTSAFILDWDYKLEGEESHIHTHTHTEEERERVCARMIDLIFSFSLVDGWMDWRFFCCACVPYHFIYRREEKKMKMKKGREGK